MTNFRQLSREYDDLLERRYSDEFDAADDKIIFLESTIADFEADPWFDQMARILKFLDSYEGNTDQVEAVLIEVLDNPKVKEILDLAIRAEAEAEYEYLLNSVNDDY